MKDPFNRNINKPTLILGILLSISLIALITIGTLLGVYVNQNNSLKAELEQKNIQIRESNKDKVELAAKSNKINLLNDKIKKLEEELENKENTTSPQNNLRDFAEYIRNNRSNTQSVNTKDDEQTCLSPGCNNSPKYNSYYCARHECFDPSCHNPKANDFTQYCIDHKCMHPDCNNGRAYGKYYCIIHSK